jgi:hypothetical protein
MSSSQSITSGFRSVVCFCSVWCGWTLTSFVHRPDWNQDNAGRVHGLPDCRRVRHCIAPAPPATRSSPDVRAACRYFVMQWALGQAQENIGTQGEQLRGTAVDTPELSQAANEQRQGLQVRARVLNARPAFSVLNSSALFRTSSARSRPSRTRAAAQAARAHRHSCASATGDCGRTTSHAECKGECDGCDAR